MFSTFLFANKNEIKGSIRDLLPSELSESVFCQPVTKSKIEPAIGTQPKLFHLNLIMIALSTNLKPASSLELWPSNPTLKVLNRGWILLSFVVLIHSVTVCLPSADLLALHCCSWLAAHEKNVWPPHRSAATSLCGKQGNSILFSPTNRGMRLI